MISSPDGAGALNGLGSLKPVDPTNRHSRYVRNGSEAEVRNSQRDFSPRQHAMLARPSAIGQEQSFPYVTGPLTQLISNDNGPKTQQDGVAGKAESDESA